MLPNCPSKDVLQSYLVFELDQSSADAICKHLEVCPDCENQTRQLENSSNFTLGIGELVEDLVDIDEADLPNLDADSLLLRQDNPISDNFESEESMMEKLHFSNYRLEKVLGRGGMGVVFLAEQLSTKRRVALKIIDPSRQSFVDWEKRFNYRQRFTAEITTAARIDHPNVVTIFEGGEENGCQFCAMKLIEGQSLSQLVFDGLEVDLAAEYIRQAALGVAAAHKIGVIHRDIKPQNILIQEQCNLAKVSDFGLAKLTGETDMPAVTQAESVFGTIDYISPEQLNDSSNVSESTDVYALGASLYYCLVGRPPLRSKSVTQHIRQIMENEPIEPTRLVDGLHPDLNAICLKCLEKKPDKRYGSALELAEDIQRYFDNIPTKARPATVLTRCRKICMRNKLVSSLVASLTLMLLLGLFLGIFSYLKVVNVNKELAASNHQTLVANEKLSEAMLYEKEIREQTEEALLIGQNAIKNFYLDMAESPEFLRDVDGAQPIRLELVKLAAGQFEQLAKLKDTPVLKYFHILSLANYGELQARLGDYDSAFATLGTAEISIAELLDSEPDSLKHRRLMHRILTAQSSVYREKAQLHEATEKLRQAFEISSALTAEDESNKAQAVCLATTTAYAILLKRTNRGQQARAVIEQGNPIAKLLVRELETKTSPDSSSELASLQADSNIEEQSERTYLYGSVLHFYRSYLYVNGTMNSEGASQNIRRWLNWLDNMELDELSTNLRELRAGLYNDFSVSLSRSAQQHSLNFQQKAVEEYRKLFDGNKQVPKLRYTYAMSLRNLSTQYSRLRQFDQAERAIVEAEELIAHFSQSERQQLRFAKGIASIYTARASHFMQKRDLKSALHYNENRLAIYLDLMKKTKNAENLALVAEGFQQNSQIFLLSGQYFRAIAALSHSLKFYDQLTPSKSNINNPKLQKLFSEIVKKFAFDLWSRLGSSRFH